MTDTATLSRVVIDLKKNLHRKDFVDLKDRNRYLWREVYKNASLLSNCDFEFVRHGRRFRCQLVELLFRYEIARKIVRVDLFGEAIFGSSAEFRYGSWHYVEPAPYFEFYTPNFDLKTKGKKIICHHSPDDRFTIHADGDRLDWG